MDTPLRIALRREPGAFVRSLTALLLRIGLGMIFLTAGIQKFEATKAGKYPAMITDRYGDKIVYPGDVALFARVLPYAEALLGAALILGLSTSLAAFATGLLLLVLLFGHIHKHTIDMYPTMLIYLLVDAGIMWLSPVTSNYLSIDGLLYGWWWAPRHDGEFRREPPPDPRRIGL